MPHLQNTCYGYPPWRLRTTSDRDITTHKNTDTEIEHVQEFHHVSPNDFEESNPNNPTKLTLITKELDDLHQQNQAGEGQPSEALNCIECKLQRLSLSLCPSAPLEPLGDVLNQYIDTLCSAQKKTNFTNTLIQDIPIFNGNDATQLEDWLVDIETATDLSAESRTKLAQAKSKGLTHTLNTEALTSSKCWDDIKDLLHLKLCNSGILTSVSCFMEIQQKEKELLVVYIHLFKREAKRCNFTNSTTTIMLFVKGLKNAHTLVT